MTIFLVDNGVEKEEGSITKDYGDYFIEEIRDKFFSLI